MLVSLQLHGVPFLAMSLSLIIIIIIIIEYQALLSLSIKNCKQLHEEAWKCHCFFSWYTCPLSALAVLAPGCPSAALS